MPDPGEYVAALPSDGLSIRSPPHVPQFIADPTEEPMQMELPEINNRNKPCQVGLWSLPVSYNQPNNAPPPPASLQVFSIYELLQNIFSQGAFHVDDGKPISMGHARAGSIAIHRSRQVCRYWNSLILKSKPLLQRMLVIQTPSHLQILNPIMMSPSTNSSDIQGQFTGAIAMITLAELEERINLTNPSRYFDGLMRNEASWRKMKLIMGGKLHENYQVVLNVVLYSLGDLPDFIQFHLDFDNIDGGPTADDLIDVLIEIAELEYMYGKYHSKQSLILMLRQTCHVTHGKLGPKRAQTWNEALDEQEDSFNVLSYRPARSHPHLPERRRGGPIVGIDWYLDIHRGERETSPGLFIFNKHCSEEYAAYKGKPHFRLPPRVRRVTSAGTQGLANKRTHPTKEELRELRTKRFKK